MEVNRKFIIENYQELGDCLVIAKCDYHKDLVCDENSVKGGGWWRLDDDTITLYGSSEQFGKAELDDILKCFVNNNVFNTPLLEYPITDDFYFIYDNGNERIKIKNMKTIKDKLKDIGTLKTLCINRARDIVRIDDKEEYYFNSIEYDENTVTVKFEPKHYEERYDKLKTITLKIDEISKDDSEWINYIAELNAKCYTRIS